MVVHARTNRYYLANPLCGGSKQRDMCRVLDGVVPVPTDQANSHPLPMTVSQDFVCSVSFGTVVATGALVGVSLATSNATGALSITNPWAYDSFIRHIKEPAVWVGGVISQFITVVYNLLSDPAALLHWTEHEWAILHEWLRHIEVALIHVSHGGFH